MLKTLTKVAKLFQNLWIALILVLQNVIFGERRIKTYQETVSILPTHPTGTKKHGFSSPHKPKAIRNNVSISPTNKKKPKTSFPTPNETKSNKKHRSIHQNKQKDLKKRCCREQNTPNVKKNQEILLYSPSR